MEEQGVPLPLLLSAQDVHRTYAVSVRTWLRWVANGHAPKPTKFGRIARWKREEVAGTFERMAARSEGAHA
jgi:predicted DNA-binding transcriptional regulator AlpA